jgi:uncharacterized protein YjbJ (UPF0337 family)
MNWNQIEGNWKQLKGNAMRQWGKLNDDQLEVIAGNREHLIGKVQEVYGYTMIEAEKQIADWQKNQKDTNWRDFEKTDESSDTTKPM